MRRTTTIIAVASVCIVIALFRLTTVPSRVETCRMPHPAPLAKVDGRLYPSAAPNLTVVLMSYPKSSRFHLLKAILEEVSTWPFVGRVLLVWNGPENLLPPAIRGAVLARPLMRVLPQSHNRVDNRWRTGHHIATDAVLNLDDDVRLHEEGARCLFEVWKSMPLSIVGVDVRSHFVHPPPSGPYGPFGYAARDSSGLSKAYSISLPRAMLTHRVFYEAYAAATTADPAAAPSPIRAIVDELLCDDIAFNAVAAAEKVRRGDPAPLVVYVRAKFSPYAESHNADAMFNKPGMKPMRQKCVNRLAEALGRMTLQHRTWNVACETGG